MLARTLSILFLAVFLQTVPLTAAAPARLVADLNTSISLPNPGLGVSGPLLQFGGKVLFAAYEPGSGVELWGSDGTDVGTAMVRDICPGYCSSSPKLIGTAGAAGKEVAAFFIQSDLPSELWRTDGTREGTFSLATGLISCTALPSQAATVGGTLLFTASEGEDCGLWRTDGTVAGTRRLLSIVIPFGITQPLVEDPVRIGNRLFFFIPESGHISLWTSDGSETGTRRVRSFAWNSAGVDDHPRLLTALGTRVFFLARGEENGDEELWRSDGTPAGTQRVTDFAAPNPFVPTGFLKVLDGALYFVADDVSGGEDLFRSDGTVAGTRRVTDFGFAYPFGQGAIGPEQLTKAGGRLFFLATDGLTGWRIWTSGGTPATTAPLAGCAGNCPSVDPFKVAFAAVGSRIVFPASEPAHGIELWSTDGTGAGTRLLRDACPGPCSSAPSGFFPFRGKLAYVAGAGSVGQGFALWTTDGTPQGTSRIAVLGIPSFNWHFDPMVLGGRLFFSVSDDRRGTQLWTSDGTPQGSGLVTVIGSGPGSAPFDLTAFGNDLMFTACNGTGIGVWRSGGTAASTVLLEPTRMQCAARPSDLTAAGGLVFFLAGESSPARLWRSDGTDAGTFPVSPSTNPAYLGNLAAYHNKVYFSSNPPDSLTASLWESDGSVAGTHLAFDLPDISSLGFKQTLGQTLYFKAGSTSSGEQLWATDGTLAGTRRLTSFTNGELNVSRPPEMALVGNTVFFTPPGFYLWKTDGTPGGTAQVLPFPSSFEGRDPVSLTAFHGALYFIASTAQGRVGRGLWRSDGSMAGTVLIKAVGAPNVFSEPAPAWLTVVGDQLFFAAADGDHGVELWRTDGTADGTVLVRDIAPGSATSQPQGLTAAGGLLFFTADDGVHGVELWQSDGTEAGTRMVQDIAPGALSAHPEELTTAGGRLYFRADDGVHGSELWALDLAASGCQPSEEVLCLGGHYQVEASWRDAQGNTGRGHAVPLTADTGTFWFFDPANVEAVLKVLDGRGVNGHVWVFYGALSNVEYSLTVTDTDTGAARLYRNPPGRLASVADTLAFGPQGATGTGTSLGPAGVPAEPLATASQKAASGGCTASATRLCLQGGRFAVEARWTDFQGHTGVGTAVPLAGGDTGYFWFFDAANVEVVLKVLDGRPVNGKHWVFYGALSNVEYTLTVTDTQTGKLKTYSNPRGRLASVADTGAF
jgi:ELWxxDGT repeat protein